MTPLLLICRTSAADGDCQYGVLALNETATRRLLGYRDLIASPSVYDKSFYCIEFFDGSVDYYDAFGVEFADADALEEAGDWMALPKSVREEDLDLDAARTAAATLKVTDAGVLWSACPEHGNEYCETPELTWGQLERLLAGAADALVTVRLADNEDEEEDDE